MKTLSFALCLFLTLHGFGLCDGITVTSPGAPEGTAVKSTGESSGDVLTADGSGAASWAAAGGGGGRVDVNETMTIGSAVGDWPNCVNGVDNKTASSAITDFSGLTGWTSSHRWAYTRISTAVGAYASLYVQSTWMTATNVGPRTGVMSGSDATYVSSSAVTEVERVIPINSAGQANMWCSGAITMGTPNTVTVLWLW